MPETPPLEVAAMRWATARDDVESAAALAAFEALVAEMSEPVWRASHG